MKMPSYPTNYNGTNASGSIYVYLSSQRYQESPKYDLKTITMELSSDWD